jgi:hypothetical protein
MNNREYVLVVKVFTDGTLSEVMNHASDIGEIALEMGADSWTVQSVDGDLLWRVRHEGEL